jgi:hypothetical protein
VTQPNSATGANHDGVNLRLVWPQWQGGGHIQRQRARFGIPVGRRPPRLLPWVRQSSKRSCRRTTAPALQCRSRCQTPASRSVVVSKPRP